MDNIAFEKFLGKDFLVFKEVIRYDFKKYIEEGTYYLISFNETKEFYGLPYRTLSVQKNENNIIKAITIVSSEIITREIFDLPPCQTPSDELGITSIEDLEALKNSIFGTFEVDLTIEDDPTDNQNQKIAKFEFGSFLTDFSVRVKQQLGTDYIGFSDYEVLNVTSSANLTSLTPPFANIQLSYTQQDYAISRESYVSTVTMYSNSTVSGKLFGYDFSKGGDQIFILKMNATDGSKISGTMNGN
ncbi:hypothetical protein [Pontimicrobium sp. MEBiC01747]